MAREPKRSKTASQEAWEAWEAAPDEMIGDAALQLLVGTYHNQTTIHAKEAYRALKELQGLRALARNSFDESSDTTGTKA
jgi:hypothetical protein